MKKRINIPEQRRVAREKAMPEVKKLVKKYGRQTIAGCLNNLRDYEKKIKELQHAKEEVARLEKQI